MSTDRGRVPFAVIGVLLLVSSGVLAATTARRPAPADPAVETATDRTRAQLQTAIRLAVRRASQDAAREPVVTPANTTAGRALSNDTAFRDSLAIRIYLELRRALSGVERRRGDVAVDVSLPPVENASDLAWVTNRVSVKRADPQGTATTVTIRNLSIHVRRDDRTLQSTRLTTSVVVGTPVLAAHDRVDAYQAGLDAGLGKPGLSQHVAEAIYPIAWARALAQFYGQPIDNVVTNAHVGVVVNRGLLALQAETIGHRDQAGQRTLEIAKLKQLSKLALKGKSGPWPRVAKRSLLGGTAASPNDIRGLEPPAESADRSLAPNDTTRDDPMPVGVNETARETFTRRLIADDLNESVDAVYEARARVDARVTEREGAPPDPPASPGPGWRLVDESRTRDRSTERVDRQPPDPDPGWHTLDSFSYETTVMHTVGRTWERGNDTVSKTATSTERATVAIGVQGTHQTAEAAPERGFERPHERGRGPLDGPNFAGVEGTVRDRLVDGRGGPRALAVRATRGQLDTEPVTIRAAQPADLHDWVYRDLMGLRARLANVSVTVVRGDVAAYEVNPPAKLAERVRQRRATLVDAPSTYDSAATKARVNARAAYVDAVVRALERQADRRRQRANRTGDALGGSGSSLDGLQRAADAAVRPSPGAGTTLKGPGGPVSLRTDAAPSYLTKMALTRDTVPALDGREHPLVVRNLNLFTVPYGDAAKKAVPSASASGQVSLRTAAMGVGAQNESTNASLGDGDNRKLRRSVASANRHVRGRVRTTLTNDRFCPVASDRRAVLEDALARWPTVHDRALAYENGSATEAIVTTAADRCSLDAVERDQLAIGLRWTVGQALQDPAARPDTSTVDPVTAELRTATETAVTNVARNATERGIEKAANKSVDGIPAGLPIIPGNWYATTNVWVVQASGEYARFGVRADRGRPSSPGAGLSYVRDGDAVAIDVDDDGDGERLGRASRVSFNVTVPVSVLVPPGGTGVGDVDGVADERSAGWPSPGPETNTLGGERKPPA